MRKTVSVSLQVNKVESIDMNHFDQDDTGVGTGNLSPVRTTSHSLLFLLLSKGIDLNLPSSTFLERMCGSHKKSLTYSPAKQTMEIVRYIERR